MHTTTNLGPDDIVRLRQIPTASVARTIFGLAALVPEVTESDLRDIVDVAIRDRRASDAWLLWRLEQLRCKGRNGVSVLEAILADRDGKGHTESWLERAFLACLDQVGYPHPKLQQRIRHANGMIARVDFLYEPRTVIEVMGYRWHSSARQLARDAARRNRLTLDGYERARVHLRPGHRDTADGVDRARHEHGLRSPGPPRRPRRPALLITEGARRRAGSVIRSA